MALRFLLLSVLPWLPLAQAPAPTAPEAFEAQLAELPLRLAPDKWGQLPHPAEPGVGSLMQQIWAASESWAAAYLSTHPGTSAEELCAAFDRIPGGASEVLWMSAVQLAGGPRAAYAVAVDSPWIGIVFVVARASSGRFTVPWTIDRYAVRNSKPGDALARWAYPPLDWSGDPVGGSVNPLPPGASGRARFYVNASTRHLIASALTGHIGIWEWDGREVRHLFVEDYSLLLDEDAIVTLDGDRLCVPVKGDLRSTFTCGMCAEPWVDWTLRLLPDRVEDEGYQFETPELQVADELIVRVLAGEDTSELATPKGGARLREALEIAQAEDGLSPEGHAPISMLGDWRVERQAGGSVLYLSADSFACTAFRFQRQGARLMVADVERVTSEGAQSEPCSAPEGL